MVLKPPVALWIFSLNLGFFRGVEKVALCMLQMGYLFANVSFGNSIPSANRLGG
jgi:hypothetical protein